MLSVKAVRSIFVSCKFSILFQKMLVRSLPDIVVKVNIYVQEKQYAWVKWGGLKSTLFSIKNGTRQLSILSPILFSLSVDRLLVELRAFSIGCQVAGVYRPNLTFVMTCSSFLPQEMACRSWMKLVKDLPITCRSQLTPILTKARVQPTKEHPKPSQTYTLYNPIYILVYCIFNYYESPCRCDVQQYKYYFKNKCIFIF